MCAHQGKGGTWSNYVGDRCFSVYIHIDIALSRCNKSNKKCHSQYICNMLTNSPTFDDFQYHVLGIFVHGESWKCKWCDAS